MMSSIMRQLKPVVMGAVFTLVAMAFAYAVPRAIQLEPTSDDGEVVVTVSECPEDDPVVDEGTDEDGVVEEGTEGEGTEVEEGTEGEETEVEEGTEGEETEVEEGTEGEETVDECEGDDEAEPEVVEDDAEEGDSGEAENHGQVVRVAAHCPIKGKAHGELVRSIAQDKEATVEDAEAACEEAMAAAQAAGDSKGKPEKEPKEHGKPERAGQGKSKHSDDSGDGEEDGSDVETSDVESSEVESDSAPSSSGQGNGKAKGKDK